MRATLPRISPSLASPFSSKWLTSLSLKAPNGYLKQVITITMKAGI
jgi:hypothetical protein